MDRTAIMMQRSMRKTRMAIRFTGPELVAVEQLAKREYLVPSALVRRLVLRECEQAGIPSRQVEQTELVSGPADGPVQPAA